MSDQRTSYQEEISKVQASKKEHDASDCIRTAGSISMSAQMFEQLYLSPPNRVNGRLRQTFGNPTPICLGSFLLCSTSLSMVLLGWQDVSGLGTANLGAYYYLGGVVEMVGAVGEWILGNTFPAVVFFLFSGFWLTLGTALNGNSGASLAYSPDPQIPGSGQNQPAFYATIGFFLVTMVILTTIFCIISIRTNVMFFLVFLTLTPSVGCLSGAFFALAHGNAATAAGLQRVGAGLLLAVSLLGWYIFISLVFLAVDFPIQLPMGDLSTVIKGASDRAAKSSGDAALSV